MMKWVFGADTTPFRKGLDDMRTQTKAFAGSLKGMLAGALGVGSIVAGVKTIVDYFSRIQDLANRFGESAETIQRVGAAAKLAGSDLEGVAKAMTVVTKNAYSAATQGGAMADSFAALGIDAGSFVNLPLNEKLLILAKAMESGKGSGENLAMMMQVLGKSGADMIPLLNQGFEELKKQMEETSVASNDTVKQLAKFDDQLDNLKQKAMVAGAEIFGFFEKVSIGISAMFYKAGEDVSTLMEGAKGAASSWWDVIKAKMNGDTEGMLSALEKFQQSAQNTKDQLKDNKSGANSEMDKLLENSKVKTKAKNNEGIENSQDALKTEDQKKKLAEDIAKLEEDSAMKKLSIAEQILKLEEKRASITNDLSKEDEVGKLEARKEDLKIQTEITKLKEDQAKIDEDSSKKQNDLTEKTAKEIADAKADEKKSDRDIAFNKLDDAGKAKMLRKEEKDLLKESQDLYIKGDAEGSIRARTASKEKGADASTIEAQIAEKASEKAKILPTIATSSLASIGAGGSSNLLSAGTQKIDRQISILEQIAQNTARTETGSQKIPEPI